MSQLKEKGIVSSGSDLADILNKVPTVSAPVTIPQIPIIPIASTPTVTTYAPIPPQPSAAQLPIPPSQNAFPPGFASFSDEYINICCDSLSERE